MNYFFFTFTDEISAEISVPKFRNDGQYAESMHLYGAKVVDNSWFFYSAEVDESSNFWNIAATEENRNDIFFIATPEQFALQSNSESLIYLNDFTKTWPDFRCNLSIANSQGGFSSYQSEYPFTMVGKKGSLYSSIATLSNSDAKKNIIFVRNIYSQPITDKYLAYLYDSCNEKVLNEIELQTNCSNVIEISEYSQYFENLYLYCDGYLGVPIFCSQYSTGSLSFEHTHPPHENVMDSRKYQIVGELKNELRKKIAEASLE